MSNTTNPYVSVIERSYVSIVTYRDDRKAGYIGWTLHWDGDPHSEPSDGDAPAVYYLVETSSQQYSEEYGEPTYGTQVWRIEGKEVTHDAWFAWSSDDPVKAVKELCDVYVVAGEDGSPAIPPVDPDSLRVVRAIDSSYCYLVYTDMRDTETYSAGPDFVKHAPDAIVMLANAVRLLAFHVERVRDEWQSREELRGIRDDMEDLIYTIKGRR